MTTDEHVGRPVDSSAVATVARAVAGMARVAFTGETAVRRVAIAAVRALLADDISESGADRAAPVFVDGLDPNADAIVTVDANGRMSLFGRIEDPAAARQRAVGPVEVAVLGPTEIRGVTTNLRGRPLLTELVVYLALHPEGALTRTWSNALWPDRIVPPQTISNRLSEARQLLGFAPDDRPRLRRDGDRHRIADVTTDWQRFQELADSDDPESWRAALSLVRGRPLSDLAQGQWATMEGVVTEIEQRVVECGVALARVLLRDGDADGAAWAAQMALRCSPWDERLHRVLMRAADASGNRQGIESAMRHLALVLEIDGDPVHRVHPQTAALYARLTQPSSIATT